MSDSSPEPTPTLEELIAKLDQPEESRQHRPVDGPPEPGSIEDEFGLEWYDFSFGEDDD